MSLQSLTYESLRSELNTGDIILYSGNTAFSSAIQLATRSRWSHCGMVLKLEEYDFLTVWESTLLTRIEDVDTREYMMGVQLMPLSQRVDKYDGEIAVRQLNGVNFGKTEIESLMNLRKRLSRKPYEKKALELARSAYDGIGGENQEDLTSVFCSELVAEAYQCLGLLPKDIPSNEYTPADFDQRYNHKLNLLEGTLGDEIVIDTSR